MSLALSCRGIGALETTDTNAGLSEVTDTPVGLELNGLLRRRKGTHVKVDTKYGEDGR